jgi:hypothetical protein
LRTFTGFFISNYRLAPPFFTLDKGRDDLVEGAGMCYQGTCPLFLLYLKE